LTCAVLPGEMLECKLHLAESGNKFRFMKRTHPTMGMLPNQGRHPHGGHHTDKPVNQFLWTSFPLQDTVIALATERGHGQPEALPSLITRANPGVVVELTGVGRALNPDPLKQLKI
jgi:hypothetical protein